MSKSRSRLAADWMAKLRANATTGEVEHDDVTTLDAEVSNTVNTEIATLQNTINTDLTQDGYIKVKTNATEPTNPVVGQLWTDSNNGIVKSWNGTKWLDCSNLFKCTGGIETSYESGGVTYKVHKFTTSGVLEVTGSGKVDVLVVGGGGGGGNHAAPGGGGAGGLIYKTSLSLISGSHTVTIGAGGGGSDRVNNATSIGSKGGNSSFYGLTALGGGLGCSWDISQDDVPYRSGGSGGGWGTGGSTSIRNGTGVGLQPSQSGDSGTYGFGSNGGDGYESNPYPGGGGGGAGGAGENYPNTGTAGRGGIGKLLDITGTSEYYAGGGQGGAWSVVTMPVNNPGGGGQGDAGNSSGSGTSMRGFSGYSLGQDGTANTGGGGGGAGRTGGEPMYGGSGGSGVVIIRYSI
jgi:hypothetical protein